MVQLFIYFCCCWEYVTRTDNLKDLVDVLPRWKLKLIICHIPYFYLTKLAQCNSYTINAFILRPRSSALFMSALSFHISIYAACILSFLCTACILTCRGRSLIFHCHGIFSHVKDYDSVWNICQYNAWKDHLNWIEQHFVSEIHTTWLCAFQGLPTVVYWKSFRKVLVQF